ncbi:hypothetical protein [Erwinia mallotivora]|uniref:ApeA N-terminal domain-containing protein n=1 Tax=Erwinia mallotivora TaxID=69222 RepID=A0A014PYF1_9GAMM|nr:hypothetical protein [Erwinia mallotivora]EXU76012.1 hypothetical protein BG55_07930 [Erwinia mallotivora]
MAVKKLDNQLLTFESENEIYKDIECSIEIEDDTHWNKINITTFDSSIIKLNDKKDVRVVISTKNITGDISKKKEFIGTSITELGISWGNVTTIKFSLKPKEVFITQSIEGIKRKRIGLITYYINKSPMFSPRIITQANQHGNVKRKKGETLSINIDNEYDVKSDAFFSYTSNDGHFESDQYQALTTKTKKTKNIKEVITNEIEPSIEDILILMTFLCDRKVNSVNWRAEFSNKIIWNYKSNKLKPKDIHNEYFAELIERNLIDEFFEKTLPIYRNSTFKREINNCIHSLTIGKKTVVELTFLSYFQALESIILAFKRSTGAEFILANDKFSSLKKTLAAIIKSELINFKDERRKIKNKLNELNRPSFKESALMLFENFNIKTNDTWPLFDDKQKNITGLLTIRNVLIHGDLLPSEQFTNIIIAMEHLRIILIRCIFSLLSWDVLKTRVSEGFLLQNHNFFKPKSKETSISELNEYFTSK